MLLERSRAERVLMGSRMFDAAKQWVFPVLPRLHV